MLVTFVVLKDIDEVAATDDRRVAQMRGLSDLFVTTSDSDYVGDLVDKSGELDRQWRSAIPRANGWNAAKFPRLASV